jgi:hypothetical protein
MNDVNLAVQAFQSPCHYAIVKGKGPHVAQYFIGDAHFPPRERRLNPYAGRKGPLDGTGKDSDLGAGVRETFDLLPGNVANAASADLVGKAIKDPNRFGAYVWLHEDSLGYGKNIQAAVPAAEQQVGSGEDCG